MNASLVANETAGNSSQSSAYLSMEIQNTGNVPINGLNVTLSGVSVLLAWGTWQPNTVVTFSIPIQGSVVAVKQDSTYQLEADALYGSQARVIDDALQIVNVTAR